MTRRCVTTVVCVCLSLSLSLSGLSLWSLSRIFISPLLMREGRHKTPLSLTSHSRGEGGKKKEKRKKKKKKEKKGRATFASLFFEQPPPPPLRSFSSSCFFFSNKKQKKETYFIDKRARVPALATISSRDETCLPRYALLATRCLLLRQIKRR